MPHGWLDDNGRALSSTSGQLNCRVDSVVWECKIVGKVSAVTKKMKKKNRDGFIIPRIKVYSGHIGTIDIPRTYRLNIIGQYSRLCHGKYWLGSDPVTNREAADESGISLEDVQSVEAVHYSSAIGVGSFKEEATKGHLSYEML